MSNMPNIGGIMGLTPPAADSAEAVRPMRAPKPADKHGWWWGTGRRKTAVARVRIKPAEGNSATFMVESQHKDAKPVDVYFTELRDQENCLAAFKVTGTMGRFQVVAKCHGGGFMGQAGAVRLAVARALRDYDPGLERALREAGFLTRDAREVERKKYGQAGARRRFQFSKR